MHYLPHISTQQHSAETFGAALWLERRYWERMETAIANGISLAFGEDHE